VSNSNPIIEEIHAIREAMAKACDNDLRTIAETAKARQRATGREVVRLPPKRPAAVKQAS
jgi:hypothetical protein